MSEGQTSFNGRIFKERSELPPEDFSETEVPGVRGSINQAIHSASRLVQAEIRLAKAEAKHASRTIARHASSLGVFALVAFFGLGCLTAALVILVGEQVFGGNFWLASVVVGFLMIAVSAVAVLAVLKKIRDEDLSFPRTRRSIQHEQVIVRDKLRAVSDAAPSLSNLRRIGGRTDDNATIKDSEEAA